MSFAKELWDGNKSLAFTFWRLGVFLTFILGCLITISFGYGNFYLQKNYNCNDASECVEIITWLAHNLSFTAFFSIWVVVQFIYIIFISICIVRSAIKYIRCDARRVDKRKIWGYLAITSVVLFILWVLIWDYIIYIIYVAYGKAYG